MSRAVDRAASLAVLVLAACGGGGDGPPQEPPPSAAAMVATDLQAKTLAARSIDALFAYDNMNSESLIAALVPLPVTALRARAFPLSARPRPMIVGGDGGGSDGGGTGPGSGSYPVACASGSGTTTFVDADGDHHVSAGDSATFSGTACKSSADRPWVFDGSVKVDVVGGSNIERHLFFVEAGSAQLKLAHAGTAIGGNRSATGEYLISVSNAADGAPPDQQISMPDMRIAHADAMLRLVGVSFKVLASKTIAAAAGSFETTVDGIGAVALSLAVKTPLTVDASTPRFRPSAGTVTMTGGGFSLDVEYGAGDAVTIRVDNGHDGSVDRTVTTTVTELDSLLTVK